MEIGIGIHGEPGRTRMPLKSAQEITGLLANAVLDDLPFKQGDAVLAFVNGMGGTPLIELYIVYQELAKICAGARHPHRPQPGRLVHHLAGYGGLFDHAARAG